MADKKIRAEIEAVDRATSVLRKVAGEVNGVQASFEHAATAAKNIFIGGAITGAAYEGLHKVIETGLEYGGMVADMKDRTGLAADEVQRLAFIAKMSDVDIGLLAKANKQLAVSAYEAAGGNKALADIFARNKIDIKDSNKILENSIFALSRIENPTQRAAEAQKVFGKASNEMIAIIGKGEPALRELMAGYEEIGGGLSDAMIDKLDAAKDATDVTNAAMTRLAAVLTVTLSPAIQEAAEFWSNFVADMTKPDNENRLDEATEMVRSLSDKINVAKIKMYADRKSTHGWFYDLWYGDKEDRDKDAAENIAYLNLQLDVWKKKRDALKEDIDKDKPAAGKPVASMSPGGDHPSGGSGKTPDERLGEMAYKAWKEAEEKDAQARWDAREAEKKEAVDFDNWEVAQQAKADALLLDMKEKYYENQKRLRENALEDQRTSERLSVDLVASTNGALTNLGRMALESSRVDARKRKDMLTAMAIADAGGAAVKGIYTVWNGPGEAWYKIGMTAVTVAEIVGSAWAQINNIEAATFAGGGIVGGSSYTGDQVPARVNSGEMILNSSQQAQLFKMANGGQTTNNNGNTYQFVFNYADRSASETIIADLRSGRGDQVVQELARRMVSSGALRE